MTSGVESAVPTPGPGVSAGIAPDEVRTAISAILAEFDELSVRTNETPAAAASVSEASTETAESAETAHAADAAPRTHPATAELEILRAQTELLEQAHRVLAEALDKGTSERGTTETDTGGPQPPRR